MPDASGKPAPAGAVSEIEAVVQTYFDGLYEGNVEKLGAKGAQVRAQSVLALGPTSTPLDLILMDPPYASGAGWVAADKLARLGWIGPATWVSVETGRTEDVDASGFVVDAERVYGKAKLTLLRRAEPATDPQD